MAAQRVAVHRVPRDAELVRDEFGRLAHRPVLERAPQAIHDEGVAKHGVTVAQLIGAAVDEVRRAAHALDTAADVEVAVSGANGLRGEHDGLEAGAADLVDRARPDGLGHATSNGALAGDVLAQARRDDVAHVHLVDLGRIADSGPFERGGNDRRAKLDGRNIGQSPGEATDRCARRPEDHDFVNGRHRSGRMLVGVIQSSS